MRKEKKNKLLFSQQIELRMQKAKTKPMLPSLREKKRYLAFEIISRQKLDNYQQVADAINYTALQFLGELGYGNAGIRIMHDQWDAAKQRGLVKVSHNHVNHMRTALMMISSIDKNEVIFRTVGVSGILKKARNRYIQPT